MYQKYYDTSKLGKMIKEYKTKAENFFENNEKELSDKELKDKFQEMSKNFIKDYYKDIEYSNEFTPIVSGRINGDILKIFHKRASNPEYKMGIDQDFVRNSLVGQKSDMELNQQYHEFKVDFYNSKYNGRMQHYSPFKDCILGFVIDDNEVKKDDAIILFDKNGNKHEINAEIEKLSEIEKKQCVNAYCFYQHLEIKYPDCAIGLQNNKEKVNNRFENLVIPDDLRNNKAGKEQDLER